MQFRRPLIRAVTVTAVVTVLVVAGGQAGVGPLAAITPPDQVTEPREMLARAVQSVIDADSLHVQASLSGHAPGAVFGRPGAPVTLDGTTVAMDLRPHDAKTRTHLVSPALGLAGDAMTVWDSLYTRSDGTGPWTKSSLGAAVGGAGIDANPLTLVDRLRTWLQTPGVPAPTVRDVPCSGESGRCHEITLEAGTVPASVLGRLLPAGGAAAVGPAETTLTVLVDVATLRPAHVEMTVENADGTVSLELKADASAWDAPMVIEEPPAG